MTAATRILHTFRADDASARDELMAVVYQELRRIAAAKLRGERQPGETLRATALVHEAWLRLGGNALENRAHFFGAAAEAMRRILVERARRKSCQKHGAGAEHCDLAELEIAAPIADGDELLIVHEALDALAQCDPRKAELVKLRYFVGLSFEKTAEVLGICVLTAKRDWEYARAWLRQEINAGWAE
ncbi:MAG: ECF-type sigma factor [Verrucomicrobiota bacterium]|nr:ECF-type sigma factor [Verrucomicrobiota bacterium]